MCAQKTEYDPTPPKLTYLFGKDFFADDRDIAKLDKEQAFKNYCKYLSDGNTKVYARRRAGLSANQIESRRKSSTEFCGMEERALDEGCDCIEQEAIRRGRDGYMRDIYYKGEVVGQEMVYSDALLQAVLKAKKPEYRESRNVVSAEINSNVTQQPAIDVTKYTEEELLALEGLLLKGGSE